MAHAYPPGGENPAWGQPVIPPPQQPGTIPPKQYVAPTQSLSPPSSGTWTTGICGCCEEVESCCWAFWCPCVAFGRIVEIVDEGNTSCLTGGAIWYLIHQHTCCGALYSCGYRTKLREKYGLPEEPCNDCCTDCFCLPCSLAQQTRELQNHGLNPNLGWDANREAYLSPPQIPKMQQM
jgi:Cys-rich protein (TIGR01571 family)